MKRVQSKLTWFENTWLVWIGFIGIFLTLLVPPMQKPDEYLHFKKAVSMSNGLFFCPSASHQYKMQNTYNDVITLVNSYSLAQNPGGKFYYKEFVRPLFRDQQGKILIHTSDPLVCGLPSLGYLPQTVGLIIANLFQLNGFYGFYLGRLFGFLTFFAVLVQVVRFSHTKIRPLFLVFSSLPMVLHQTGAYSYDSAQMTVGIVLFFLLFKLIDQQKINWKVLLLFLCSLFVFYLTKYQSFWLFFALPLLVIDKVVATKQKVKSALVIGIYTVVVLLTFITNQLNTFSSSDAPPTSELTPQTIQRSIITTDPIRILEMFIETTQVQGWFYFNSFFGNFGWLDYELKLGVYLLFFGLLIHSASRFSLPNQTSYPLVKAMLCMTILVLSYVLILFGFFLSNTPVNDEIGGIVSHGVQGRYFLLLVPIAFLFVGYLKQSKFGKPLLYGLFGLFIAYRIIYAVFLRYYDYQSNYDFVTEHQAINESEIVGTIDSALGIEMSVLPNRKIKGFTLGPIAIAEKKGVRMPYEYSVRSGACTETGEILVRDYVMNRHYHTTQLEVVFRKVSISTTANTQYCVTIKPYADYSQETLNYQYLGRSALLSATAAYLR